MKKRELLYIKAKEVKEDKFDIRVRGQAIKIITVVLGILHDLWMKNPDARSAIEGATRNLLDKVFEESEPEKEEEA